MSSSAIEFGFKASTIVDDEGRTTWQNVRAIGDWSKCAEDAKKAAVPCDLTDEQICCFLLSCDDDLEMTKRTIEHYYKSRRDGPQLFANRNAVDDADVLRQLTVVQVSVFPTRTDDGHAVIFHRLQDSDYSHYQIDVAMKILFMTLDAAIYDRPPNGLIILFDMRGIGLMHLTRVRLGLVKTFCHYLQEGLPVKLKAIHVLNSAYFVEKVVAIVRPFLAKEVLDLIHFHPPTMDMQLFYAKCIPRKCLPSDFGGDLPHAAQLHSETKKTMESMADFFAAEEEQRKRTNASLA